MLSLIHIYESSKIYCAAPLTDGKSYAAAQAALKTNEEQFFTQEELNRMPVSYTHLDVYKRQVLDKEQTLAALKIRKLFNQLVFATEKSLQYLHFEGRELV